MTLYKIKPRHPRCTPNGFELSCAGSGTEGAEGDEREAVPGNKCAYEAGARHRCSRRPGACPCARTCHRHSVSRRALPDPRVRTNISEICKLMIQGFQGSAGMHCTLRCDVVQDLSCQGMCQDLERVLRQMHRQFLMLCCSAYVCLLRTYTCQLSAAARS